MCTCTSTQNNKGNMDIQSKATNVYIIVQGNKWLNLTYGK